MSGSNDRYWRNATPTAGTKQLTDAVVWLLVAGFFAAVFWVIVIVAVIAHPWESQKYTDCVSMNNAQFNNNLSNQEKQGIESYCHSLYG